MEQAEPAEPAAPRGSRRVEQEGEAGRWRLQLLILSLLRLFHKDDRWWLGVKGLSGEAGDVQGLQRLGAPGLDLVINNPLVINIWSLISPPDHLDPAEPHLTDLLHPPSWS